MKKLNLEEYRMKNGQLICPVCMGGPAKYFLNTNEGCIRQIPVCHKCSKASAKYDKEEIINRLQNAVIRIKTGVWEKDGEIQKYTRKEKKRNSTH